MSLNERIRSLLITITLVAATASRAGPPAPPVSRSDLPIRHVFVIVLENEGYSATFGPSSKAPYLGHELAAKGVLLSQYFGTAHFSLGNYIAMISGQAGTQETRDDCERFADFVLEGVTSNDIAIGHGCVYPQRVKTLADQLTAKGLSWRAYMEDMGNDPARETATCGHPPIDAQDPTQSAEAPSAAVPAGDQYAVRHNPFVYFHSIIDSPTCRRNVVNLAQLARDLARPRRVANFSFISPNLCHDGHDEPCKSGEPGGLASADAFLRVWVPRILASAAYREDGILLITFDEGDTPSVPDGKGGYRIDAMGESCCGQQPGPNLGPFPQHQQDGEYTETFASFGGDRTGAVLLSPFLRAGTVSNTPFNHYSLLKTLEDVFAVGGHLGYAGEPGLVGFFERPGSDVAVLAGFAGRDARSK